MDISELNSFEIVEDKEQPVNKDLPVAPIVTNNLLAVAAIDSGVTISQEQLSFLDTFMANVMHGHQSSLPMVCKAEQCPFIGLCPLKQAKIKLPIGKQCTVEKAVMAQWVQVTLNALNIDPNNPENAVDISMVFELAGLEMLRYRAAWHLSTSPNLVEERIVGYSPQGDPIYAEQPKAALIVLEKYGKLVSKLRDQLLATRRAQAQVGKLSNDLSMRGAELLSKARELAEKRRQNSNTVEAEFTIANEQSKQTGAEQDK